ncbi:ABC transporter permease [Geodermatophilus marinus]|uniref:ABC transporter permease n=1 Tax=Geodermatophilus sp. LHW52908 TaxID=2303986 RepID=UPI000E3D19AC|nr:ABC transporter permease [Geodermatophilus sp. LHW52908]RFU20076.1 ABC transporter permease [Geodermatophilus sp. LHW52908]
MLTLARSELVQILRNRAVLITSLLMPLAVGAFFVYSRDTFAELYGLGYIAAVVVFTIGAFSLYSTIVTTLAARRQTLFLKRLRSTAASDREILSGLVLPVTVIAVVQVALILGVFAAVSQAPADVLVLALAVVATFAMMLALGVATAGVTGSPEKAQVTTLPIALGTIGVASWVGIAGTESLTWLKRALPGGSATELVVGTWDGGLAVTESLRLLLPTVGWVVVAVWLAARFFRWEPRR